MSNNNCRPAVEETSAKSCCGRCNTLVDKFSKLEQLLLQNEVKVNKKLNAILTCIEDRGQESLLPQPSRTLEELSSMLDHEALVRDIIL
jgi:hypothetical protein